jgi:hypothetical protein
VHRTCTGEGRHIRSETCEIDHILPSAAGGPTVPDNGRPQCRPTTDNTTGPSQPPGDHHPTPTTATASPAPPTSSSPEPASATAYSTTPPGAPSPPHATKRDVRVRGSRPRPGRARWRRGWWRRSRRRGRPP